MVIRLRGRAKGGNILLLSEPFPIWVHGVGNYRLRQIPESGGNLHTATNLLKRINAQAVELKEAVIIFLISQKDSVILFYKSDSSIIPKVLTFEML